MDAFETELEKSYIHHQEAANRIKKEYGQFDNSYARHLATAKCLGHFLDLYRSAPIKADRLAGALEEMANDTSSSLAIDACFQLSKHDPESNPFIRRCMLNAARAIREKQEKKQLEEKYGPAKEVEHYHVAKDDAGSLEIDTSHCLACQLIKHDEEQRDKQRDEELAEGIAKFYWNLKTSTESWELLSDYAKALQVDRARAAIKAARGD